VVRIELVLEDERYFRPGCKVVVVGKTGSCDSEVEFFRRQHGRYVLKLRATDSIAEAERIVGAEIGIRKNDLLPPENGSFYTFQLKGCAVYDGDDFIGIVTEVLDNGGVGILKVDRDQDETLIPFAHSYLKRIDLGLRRIDVDLPEGLRDINK
jgi:16S rRNA processing protein RimM